MGKEQAATEQPRPIKHRKAFGVDLSPPRALSLAPSSTLSRTPWTEPRRAFTRRRSKASKGPHALDSSTPTMQLETSNYGQRKTLWQRRRPVQDAHHRSRPLSPPTGSRPLPRPFDLSSLPAGIHPRGERGRGRPALAGFPRTDSPSAVPFERRSPRLSRSVLIDGPLRISLSGQTRRGKELSRRIMLPANPKWLGQRSVAVDQARHGLHQNTVPS